MGIIATVTPGLKRATAVKRVKADAKDLIARGKINIRVFKPSADTYIPIIYGKLQPLMYIDPTSKLDFLWKITWPLRSPRTSWSGFMQGVCQGGYPGQSLVTFLPFIDLNPTDLSCVYSTLKFVCDEAKRHGVTPIVTFDQPLWWKAQTIVASEPHDEDLQSMILRLGGFHTEISFLGCIGYLMSGTGLQELLETIYAPNAVVHMLGGKAVV